MEYLTDEQIVNDLLLYKLKEDDKVWLKNLPERGVISTHHGLGQWIRNNYGLWHEENPYTDIKADGPRFPDSVSARIIEEIWVKLGNEKTFYVKHTKEEQPDGSVLHVMEEVPISPNYKPETPEMRRARMIAVYGEDLVKMMEEDRTAGSGREG